MFSVWEPCPHRPSYEQRPLFSFQGDFQDADYCDKVIQNQIQAMDADTKEGYAKMLCSSQSVNSDL